MILTNKSFNASKLKVYIQPPYIGSEREIFRDKKYLLSGIDDADIIVWTGGSDINPALYGERPLQYTSWNRERDDQEVKLWRITQDKFKVGICRGGQLLNVLNGGKLWQHVTNHGRTHFITDAFTGTRLKTSSVHHQAFRPAENAIIVATCQESGAKFAENYQWQLPVLKREQPHNVKKWEEEIATDYEVLWYPDTKSLCFQGHPEFGPDECTEYFFELIARYYEEAA